MNKTKLQYELRSLLTVYHRRVRTNPAVFERVHRACREGLLNNERCKENGYRTIERSNTDERRSLLQWQLLFTKHNKTQKIARDQSGKSLLFTFCHRVVADKDSQWQWGLRVLSSETATNTRGTSHNLETLMWGPYIDHLHSHFSSATPICGNIDGEFATSYFYKIFRLVWKCPVNLYGSRMDSKDKLRHLVFEMTAFWLHGMAIGEQL